MVYDCLIFYNEIDLLKIRLKVLDPYVDYFVIVESDRDFRDNYKPYYFEKNINKFTTYKDKIIHIKLNERVKYSGENDWSIQIFQRNSILRGLIRCQSDDLILISDIDEIPSPYIFENFDSIYAYIIDGLNLKNNIKLTIGTLSFLGFKTLKKAKNGKILLKDALEEGPVVCSQKMFYYYMNCRENKPWKGTVISKYKNLIMPDKQRNLRYLFPYIKNAGWHFSYLGGIERVKTKFKTIVGGTDELIKIMNERMNDEEYINYCVNNGIDIFGRKGIKFKFIQKEEIGIKCIDEIIDLNPNFYKEI